MMSTIPIQNAGSCPDTRKRTNDFHHTRSESRYAPSIFLHGGRIYGKRPVELALHNLLILRGTGYLLEFLKFFPGKLFVAVILPN